MTDDHPVALCFAAYEISLMVVSGFVSDGFGIILWAAMMLGAPLFMGIALWA
jgi:hypothetical protein